MRSRCHPYPASLALLVLGVCVPPEASAWGNDGHKIVCEIAFRELDANVQNKIRGILGAEPLSEACTWPDKQGEEQRARRPEHYLNVPRYWNSIWYEECPDADRCLFTAIRADESKLAAPAASTADKRAALRFLGHWVGDIHQPLHISYSDDRGGNEITIQAGLGCSKLHAVWDTCIPRYLMATAAEEDPLAYAGVLQKEITAEERAAWTSDTSPVAWANESYAIARKPEVEYCTLDGKKCDYSADSVEYDPEQDEMRHLSLSTSYEEKHGAVVARRLKQAGVRLAVLLKAALR